MSTFLRSTSLCIVHNHDQRLVRLAAVVCAVGVYAGDLATIVGKILDEIGPGPIQDYYISRPLLADVFASFIKRYKTRNFALAPAT